MERENSNNDNIHVVLLPFSAFGHLLPFHQLAIALAKSGVRVSYISTPKNIERLPKPPHNLSLLINFVSLPFPILDSYPLPDGAEATVDLPLEKYEFFMIAFDLLKLPFERFVSEQKPNWVVIDCFSHWGAEVAKNCGVPVVALSVFPTATSVFFGAHEVLTGEEGQKKTRSTPESLTSPPPWVTFPSEVAFRQFEAVGAVAGLYGRNLTGFSLCERFARAFELSQVVAIRSCPEFEGEYLRLFSELIGKPVIPMGLLPRKNVDRREITDKSFGEMFDWLDEQDPKSVVYVAFGSESKLTKEQIYEIAYGLEESHIPFLWALRKPRWAIDDSDALPPGFSQTSNKHKVCMGWAPQMEILSHPSIGGSLFHAGWGSVIETLQFGHALVVLPLMFDQPLSARLVVEKGLAIEVERGEDGSFKSDDIALSLRRAMVSEEGEGMKARLREASRVVGDLKLHDHYIDEFVEFLKNGVGKPQ